MSCSEHDWRFVYFGVDKGWFICALCGNTESFAQGVGAIFARENEKEEKLNKKRSKK